ncbi:cytochrome P450 71AU50-like [Euphorbia lathyris]|uniref:cytochrome P450 71AU50-like n=1 Tax=Euphorbia lathyris TaxID=212925 RepID=UPI0033144DCB
MALALTAVSLVAIVFLVQAWRKITNSKNKLPPGPLGFPIFGHLHLFMNCPHRTLHELAKRYGPIMHLRLGQVGVVVVSSPKLAESFLKTHDLVFADRPFVDAASYLTYNHKNISGSPYGSYWRNVGKMCTTQLLSNQKIESFRSMRKEELNLLVDHIKEASCQGIAVDLRDKITSLSADMSCRMVFGKKYMANEFDERGFLAVMKEFLRILSIPNLGDYFPLIAPFDVQRLTKKIEAVSKVFDRFLEKIIDEHIQFKEDKHTKDFVDIMLEFMGSEESEYRMGRDNIKAIMLDMLVGAMDTTSTSIDWILSETMRHPRVMKKVQNELEEKVGRGRIVEESDLGNLEYLDMVIKETLRLHPIAPLLIPHKASQDTIVNGFLIPKDSQIFINAWAIGRDPSAWPDDAEKFWPERFIGRNIDVQGRNFELLPFGSGRRGCPGIQLGLTVTKLVVAQLLHCFDWKLPNHMLPTGLDMTEKVGIVTVRATHLQAIPSYRLQV